MSLEEIKEYIKDKVFPLLPNDIDKAKEVLSPIGYFIMEFEDSLYIVPKNPNDDAIKVVYK